MFWTLSQSAFTMITRNTLLSCISISMSIVFTLMAILLPATKSIHFAVVGGLFISVELMTSFWGAILGYRAFNDWYIKICGCCDRKCKSCCGSIIGNTDEMQMVKEIEASNPTSTTQVTIS